MKLQPVRYAVSPTQWRPFDIKKYRPTHTSGPIDQIYEFLSERICVTGKPVEYWIKQENELDWVCVATQKVAVQTAYNIWGTHASLQAKLSIQHIGEQDIKHFITALPAIQNVVCFPAYDEFAVVDGKTSVNTFIDSIMPARIEDLVDDDGDVLPSVLPILRMIRYSLCAEPQFNTQQHLVSLGYSEDEAEAVVGSVDNAVLEAMELDWLLEQTGKDAEPSNFKWVMHWLANIRQNIGVNSSVALFLHGKSTGIGKNTLGQIMKLILDARQYKLIKEDEWVQGGWTDNVKGLFVHADDWENGTVRKTESKLKGFIGNDDATVRKRNKGEEAFINTTSWFFTNNDEDPIKVDDNERRFTLIKTTNDLKLGRRLARPVYKDIKNHNKRSGAIKAFNALLCCIEVCEDFISLPYENKHRAELKDINRDSIDVWYDYLVANNLTEITKSSKEWFVDFKQWYYDWYDEDTKMSSRGFGKRLSHRDWAVKDDNSTRRGWCIETSYDV